MPRAEITHWKGQDKQVEREGVVGWGKGKVSKGGESKGLSLQIPLAHSKRSLILQDIIYLFIQYLDCLMDILLSFVFLFTLRAIDILFLFFSRSLHLSFFLRICETIEMKFRKDLLPKKRVEKQKFYLFNFRTCPTFCTLFTYIFFFKRKTKTFFWVTVFSGWWREIKMADDKMAALFDVILFPVENHLCILID